jgi:hypothetical protein
MIIGSIAERTEELRQEIALIQEEERVYRSRSVRSATHRAARIEREIRVIAIREELRTFIEKAKPQSRN